MASFTSTNHQLILTSLSMSKAKCGSKYKAALQEVKKGGCLAIWTNNMGYLDKHYSASISRSLSELKYRGHIIIL